MILLLLASGFVSVIMGQIDDAISITVVSILWLAQSAAVSFHDKWYQLAILHWLNFETTSQNTVKTLNRGWKKIRNAYWINISFLTSKQHSNYVVSQIKVE